MDASAPNWLTEPWLTVLLASAFLLPALCFPVASETIFRGFENLLARIAARRAVAVGIIFLLVLIVRLALLPQLPVPNPGIHDEFSYLLMGDTFAHARLANPPHPLWKSFETFHVLWSPTYGSKYPPAQGIVLAIGQLLGHPWIGVLLSAAGMAAAIVWMLQAWLPPRWALLAGFLAAARLCVASYWINSYWGGAVAAIGGALVLGALGRIKRRPTVASGIILGFGVAIVINSRPFEGLFFLVPVAAALAFWLFRARANPELASALLKKIALPAAAILFMTASLMAYYNWRVTGDPRVTPYVHAARLYDRSALFLWQTPKPPLEYNNAQLDEFYNHFERRNYDRTWPTLKSVFQEKGRRCSLVFFWPACLLLLPGTLFIFRDARFRLLLLTLAAVVFAYCLVTWPGPHYLAPATACFLALLVQCQRHLRTIRFLGRSIGAALSRAVVLALLLDVAQLPAQRIGDPQSWGGWGLVDRSDLQEKLKALPGKHVVLVRYGFGHSVHEEWVFNNADIDASVVIWARDLPGVNNDRLLLYYPERSIWLAQPDTGELNLLRAPVSPR